MKSHQRFCWFLMHCEICDRRDAELIQFGLLFFNKEPPHLLKIRQYFSTQAFITLHQTLSWLVMRIERCAFAKSKGPKMASFIKACFEVTSP